MVILFVLSDGSVGKTALCIGLFTLGGGVPSNGQISSVGLTTTDNEECEGVSPEDEWDDVDEEVDVEEDVEDEEVEDEEVDEEEGGDDEDVVVDGLAMETSESFKATLSSSAIPCVNCCSGGDLGRHLNTALKPPVFLWEH